MYNELLKIAEGEFTRQWYVNQSQGGGLNQAEVLEQAIETAIALAMINNKHKLTAEIASSEEYQTVEREQDLNLRLFDDRISRRKK